MSVQFGFELACIATLLADDRKKRPRLAELISTFEIPEFADIRLERRGLGLSFLVLLRGQQLTDLAQVDFGLASERAAFVHNVLKLSLRLRKLAIVLKIHRGFEILLLLKPSFKRSELVSQIQAMPGFEDFQVKTRSFGDLRSQRSS